MRIYKRLSDGKEVVDVSEVKTLAQIALTFGGQESDWEELAPPASPTEDDIATLRNLNKLKAIDEEFGPRYVREYFINNNLISDPTVKSKIQAAEASAVNLRQELATIKAKG